MGYSVRVGPFRVGSRGVGMRVGPVSVWPDNRRRPAPPAAMTMDPEIYAARVRQRRREVRLIVAIVVAVGVLVVVVGLLLPTPAP